MKFSEEVNAKLYTKNVAIKLKGDRIYGLEKVKQNVLWWITSEVRVNMMLNQCKLNLMLLRKREI